MRNRHLQPLQELVRRCQSGEEEAWHDMIDLLAPAIFALCRRNRLSRDESFDIFGQVCLELITALPTLRDPGKIVSFTATITRRQIYSFYQKVPIEEYLEAEHIPNAVDPAPGDPEADFERVQQRQILIEAMAGLSPRDSQLITMLFLDPDRPSYEEIARRLHMPVSSIGPIRGKALAKLRRILRQKR